MPDWMLKPLIIWDATRKERFDSPHINGSDLLIVGSSSLKVASQPIAPGEEGEVDRSTAE
ncbi:hypothetical protein A9Z06_33480 [Rhizobium sp. YK2]|nr:hypothetical protein A9Z06_33480 [Rhizobium sp. YK2]